MLLHSFIFLVFTAIAVSATGLDADTVSKVRAKMLAIVSHSWEYGTATEALLVSSFWISHDSLPIDY